MIILDIVDCFYQVYRSVLLNNGNRSEVLQSGHASSASMKPTAAPVAEYDPDFTEGRTLNRKDVALGQRGDIIEFYNKIYINYIKDFALKFQPAEEVCIFLIKDTRSFM